MSQKLVRISTRFPAMQVVLGTFVAASLLLLSSNLFAQEGMTWTAKIGGGFSSPEYSAGRHLSTGWNMTAGGGVQFSDHVSLLGEFMFNSFGINNSTLQSLQFPDGDMHLWALTAEPMIQTHRQGLFNAFLVGGGGFYHRLIEFTQPTVQSFTAFDPFFGVFYPVAVPASQVLRSESTNKGGLNIGAGISIRLGSGNRGKFFAEARYHHMYTRPNATTILPVTFGFEW